MVMNPVTSHAAINSAGESTSRAMSAETTNMPDPIIEPMTMVVALVSPSPLTSSWSGAAAVGPDAREEVDIRSVLQHLTQNPQKFLYRCLRFVTKVRDYRYGV